MCTDTTDAALVSVVYMEEIRLRLNVHCCFFVGFFFSIKASTVFLQNDNKPAEQHEQHFRFIKSTLTASQDTDSC